MLDTPSNVNDGTSNKKRPYILYFQGYIVGK